MPEFVSWGDCTIPEKLQKTFHDHLDLCKQCRENPFGLCDDGQNIMSVISFEMSRMPIIMSKTDAENIRGVRADPIFKSEED
jgi:hypothetical protein